VHLPSSVLGHFASIAPARAIVVAIAKVEAMLVQNQVLGEQVIWGSEQGASADEVCESIEEGDDEKAEEDVGLRDIVAEMVRCNRNLVVWITVLQLSGCERVGGEWRSV